jgi:hypothetical protein
VLDRSLAGAFQCAGWVFSSQRQQSLQYPQTLDATLLIKAFGPGAGVFADEPGAIQKPVGAAFDEHALRNAKRGAGEIVRRFSGRWGWIERSRTSFPWLLRSTIEDVPLHDAAPGATTLNNGLGAMFLAVLIARAALEEHGVSVTRPWRLGRGLVATARRLATGKVEIRRSMPRKKSDSRSSSGSRSRLCDPECRFTC